MQRKIGVMGGTFDPVHHGHLVAASEVADRFDLDEVLFVPTGQPWQKSARSVSPAEDRYLMTVIASARAARCGTWCRTASSSTSRRGGSTPPNSRSACRIPPSPLLSAPARPP